MKIFFNTLKEMLGNPEYLRPEPVSIRALGAYMAPTLNGEDRIGIMCISLKDDLEILDRLKSECPISEIQILFVYADGKTQLYTLPQS